MHRHSHQEREARLSRALGWVLLVLVACGPAAARAESDPQSAIMSYSFVEVDFAPFFNSPIKFADGASLTGWGVAGIISHAFHENWHLRATYLWSDSDTDSFVLLPDPITGEELLEGKLGLERQSISIMPHFNYRVAKNTDIFLGLGAVYEDIDFNVRLSDRLDLENPLEANLGSSGWGVAGRAGARSRVWRGLELFGDFNISSTGLLENEVLFNLGARWDFWDKAALSVGATAGTDSFIRVFLGVRLYYGEIYRRVKN